MGQKKSKVGTTSLSSHHEQLVCSFGQSALLRVSVAQTKAALKPCCWQDDRSPGLPQKIARCCFETPTLQKSQSLQKKKKASPGRSSRNTGGGDAGTGEELWLFREMQLRWTALCLLRELCLTSA
ncbi:hypothetical protein GN956_G16276 [Arapaima gigas]